MKQEQEVVVATHWGHYKVGAVDGKITSVKPVVTDTYPSSIGESLLDARDPNCRIAHPAVRESYLMGHKEHQKYRGRERFVQVSWDDALDLAAEAIRRVKEEYGNESIFGGSYGWASAGRFHHAQSQIHRFLNMLGGYTASVNTYSAAAAEVILPHIYPVENTSVTYTDIVKNTDLWLSFGGSSLSNNQVVPSGLGDHQDYHLLKKIADAGVEVIQISPIREDIPDFVSAEWIQARPCTDTAMMLALAYYLEQMGKVDRAFLERYTVGYDKFKEYLLGTNDGIPKNAAWASPITGICEEQIHCLARKLANSHRPLITVALSLQRQQHGEQPYWMAVVLAAMLGKIGLRGGGLGYGWGSNGRGLYTGVPFTWGYLDQARNPVNTWIPVARITDMLLNPGQDYDYNGRTRTYPDIHLIYWAGGNPFHHQMDLNRLRQAWCKPDTVIVNDSVWTATAKHADIVFPTTLFLERDDISCGFDLYISPSKQVLPPFQESRTDYEIFTELSTRLGTKTAFTDNLDTQSWIKRIYNICQTNAKEVDIELPPFDTFWQGEGICLENVVKPSQRNLDKFRDDPEANPLNTPSGKIEIFSETIASFGYADCQGHPLWLEKEEWLGAEKAKEFPLHLISHQPKNKLHSQYDFGRFSRKDEIQERATVRINPQDAKLRGITDGQIVRIFNNRGSCLAGGIVTDDVMLGVISLPTGSWFDPDESEDPTPLERHGNPNVLTPDKGTSRLAQGPTAHSCLVQVELFRGKLPEVKAFQPPRIVQKETLAPFQNLE